MYLSCSYSKVALSPAYYTHTAFKWLVKTKIPLWEISMLLAVSDYIIGYESVTVDVIS